MQTTNPPATPVVLWALGKTPRLPRSGDFGYNHGNAGSTTLDHGHAQARPPPFWVTFAPNLLRDVILQGVHQNKEWALAGPRGAGGGRELAGPGWPPLPWPSWSPPAPDTRRAGFCSMSRKFGLFLDRASLVSAGIRLGLADFVLLADCVEPSLNAPLVNSHPLGHFRRGHSRIIVPLHQADSGVVQLRGVLRFMLVSVGLRLLSRLHQHSRR
jgi:hypothetical protein